MLSQATDNDRIALGLAGAICAVCTSAQPRRVDSEHRASETRRRVAGQHVHAAIALQISELGISERAIHMH